MSRPFSPRPYFGGPQVRINGKIRSREVRVIDSDGRQLGVLALHEAITLARARDMDLVEVAANATPPVCRIVDYGKYQYEQSKKQKESKKHQHANRVKEIQLSASIDAHDFGVKLGHAIDFLCEEMKVKISLRFRGREMAHQEIGRDVVGRFIKELTPYGYAVEIPKLTGRSLNAMLTPLPRNKRAKNPRAEESTPDAGQPGKDQAPVRQVPVDGGAVPAGQPAPGESAPSSSFANSPFSQLDEQLRDRPVV
ncbi:MAG TPA: translation initiation factor IF-3 [Verrucomicrobiota bacterium]|nr:translation initiation factor IF-3 [Verrucomicrobiota bacterium]HNU52685.1 translation initiation factor IF-3 [Verrucomicrobiota bacterium]